MIKSWAYHASNGWYIGPSLKHYRCIHAIMEGTGGECLTDMFRFKHHSMPIPSITPTNQIIAVTHDLTAAILGVQEAPPDDLQAIATLCHLLLGEVPPTPVPINPSPIAPVPPPITNTVNKEPVHVWDPNARQLQHVPHTIIPSTSATPRHHAPGPNFINDDDDSPITPAPHAA
jgi:hypothetical protein